MVEIVFWQISVRCKMYYSSWQNFWTSYPEGIRRIETENAENPA